MAKDKRLQEIIESDKNLRPYALKVDEEDNHVRVTGIVDSLSEKEHAQRILKDAAGNKEIDLAISISTDGAIDDEDVQMEVGEELALHPDLKGKVGVKSVKGVAHLMGRVESKELREEATKTASKARGVTEVVNQIKVGKEEEEDLFHTQVRNDADG